MNSSEDCTEHHSNRRHLFRTKAINNSFEYDFLEEKYSESVFAIISFRYCGFRSMRESYESYDKVTELKFLILV